MLKGEARKAYEKYFMPIGEENMRKRREEHRTMKTGEKYIIEIGEVIPSTTEMNLPFPEVESNKRYLAKIKGFNSLVFDENGLKKLEKLEETEQTDRMKKYIKTLHELNETLKKSLEKDKTRSEKAEHELKEINANAGAHLIRCQECVSWRREDARSHVGYCLEHQFTRDSKDLELCIYPKTREDFFCADGEISPETINEGESL